MSTEAQEAQNELPMDTRVALSVVFSKDIKPEDMPEHVKAVLTACLVYLRGVHGDDLVEFLSNTIHNIELEIVKQHEEAVKAGMQ
jgi:hypothetical protein